MVTSSPVLPIDSHVLPGQNQETYQRLQRTVMGIPPHQIWFAVCDDLLLQRQLAATLADSVQTQGTIATTQQLFNPAVPDLVQQVQTWGQQIEPGQPKLWQILGIEQLTQCGSNQQYRFLRSLQRLRSVWQSLPCSLLIWVPRPWFRQIRREVPSLCRTVFEFMGEPTPLSVVTADWQHQAAFFPIRRWQFLGRPAPEAPSPSETQPSEPLTVTPDSTAVPAVAGEAETRPPAAAAPDAAPLTFSDDLWQRLQADLTQLEGESTTLLPPPPASLTATPAAADSLTDFGEAVLPGAAQSALNATTHEAPPIAGSPWAEAAPNEVERQSLSPSEPDPWEVAYTLRDRVQQGDRSLPVLENAIQQYEDLQAEAPTTPHRTEVLNDLGSLYWLWAQQAADAEIYQQRLTRSCALYEAALSPISPKTEAAILTRVHSNLGSVYSLLAACRDPAHYLGKAVRAFHRALQYILADATPLEYATLQTHLGTAYWSLAQHTQEATHLHRAIAAYQEALRQSHPQQMPEAYAQLQNNLGIALWSLSRHERPVFLLEQAIGVYGNALAYRTLETDPAGCAATHNNLGTAYWDLGGHQTEKSPDQIYTWQQAVAAYETALMAADQLQGGPLSFDRWATHHSAGVVCDQLAIALAPDATAQAPLLTQAFHHYRQALIGWQALAADTTETAFQALVRNLHLQARYLGLEVQQRSLSHIPADWLPEIWRKL